jgi:hypothetical protein
LGYKTYKWRCHKETPCAAFLNKSANFFLLENQGTGGWNRSCLSGVDTNGRGEGGREDGEILDKTTQAVIY